MRPSIPITVLLALSLVPFLQAAPDPASLIEPGSDVAAMIRVAEGGMGKALSAFSLSSKATLRVLEEQCKEFAASTGFNPLDVTSIVLAGRKGGPPPVLIARGKIDLAHAAEALGGLAEGSPGAAQRRPAFRVESLKIQKGERIDAVIGGAALVIFADGLIVVGPKEVAARVANPAPSGPTILADLEKALGNGNGLAVAGRFPSGVAAVLPPQVTQAIPPGLQARARGASLVLAEKRFGLTVTFDSAEAANAAKPMLPGFFSQIQGAVSQQVLAAKEEAKTQGPFGALNGALLKARVEQETLKDYLAAIDVTTSEADAILTIDRDKLEIGTTLSIATMGVLAAIAVPNFRAARDRANVRACFANQKVISGAIEMYNLDRSTKVATIDTALFEELKKGGYLQSIPQDPGAGPESSANYYSTQGGVACKVHGSVDGTVKGTATGR